MPGTATRTAANILVLVRDPREKASHLLPGYFERFLGYLYYSEYPIVGAQYQTYEERAVCAPRRSARTPNPAWLEADFVSVQPHSL